MRAFLLIVGVSLMVPTASPADANDLIRLYQLALTRDAVLQAATHQRDAAIEARPQALSQWLPQLTGTAARERHFIAEQATSFGADCSSASAVTVHCSANGTRYGLTLTQTVWSYQAYSQLREADAQAASAEATYVGAQQDLLLRVAQAYFAVLGAQDQLNTLRLEREAYAIQLKQAQDRERTGLGSRSDVEQAKSFYDLTAQSLIGSQTALDDAELTLGTLVGGPPGHVAPLVDEIPLQAPDPESPAAWVDSALRDNPDVRAAELATQAAERDISVQRGKAMPTISLTGTDAKAVGPVVIGGDNTIATVGLYFNWPLYRGGAVASAVHQSRALYRQSESILESTKRIREQQTRAAYRNVLAGIQSINAGGLARDSAFTAMQTVRHDIEFNVSPEFILLQSQAQYYLAVNAYDQARYSYLASVLILKQQAGRLTEQDLVMIDGLLVTGAANP